MLSAEQIGRFEDDGYLSLNRITSDADVARLRESYDQIFSSRAGRDVGYQFDLAGTDDEDQPASLPQILQPSKFAPEMDESELLANCKVIAGELLGPGAKCYIGHAILKPARDGAETPWHQDAAYWDPSKRFRSISIWVPLQEASLQNGCMQFVPGSHRLDVLTHRSIGGDPRVHGLELDESERHHTEKAVACPIPAGGCTIHGGYMLHYAGPNATEIPRRALIVIAESQAVDRDEPREFPWQKAWETDAGRKRKEAGLA